MSKKKRGVGSCDSATVKANPVNYAMFKDHKLVEKFTAVLQYCKII